ncbi:MAG TPA: poly(R)-hydroxyalkanoic acid synthase subunit PhaE [Deltaproteobacteria bacterium]|nr:poly(R)-hydroxyalkanoic acid synthase subunit PhaE [Deltaproteobacteria bacterium]
MDETEREKNPSVEFLQQWLNMMNQAFSGLFDGFPGRQAGDGKGGTNSTEKLSKSPQETLMSLFRTWGTVSSAMSEPAMASYMAGAMTSLPEIMTRFFQTGMSGFLKAQEQAAEKLGSLIGKTEAYRFDNLDQGSLKVWADFYEKEIRQYLKAPQLGLFRFYQEHLNQAMDKYTTMKAKLADFLHLLALPMEKSLKVLADTFEEQVKQGKVPPDPRENYRLWVKILEGHYMTLFKSDEYTRVLADTLAAFEDFVIARNRIFTDMMQALPIPTNRDLDDLYEEIYHLKKRLRELEKSRKASRKAEGPEG